MSDVELDYEYLTQRALTRVIHDVLTLTAELGATPGEHHFYIEFLTTAYGVEMPDYLRGDYPEKMTIVLQHQFDNLTVDEDGFAVSLWFKGRQARLSVPFEAITSFADPSVQFGLRFNAIAPSPDPGMAETEAPRPPDEKPEKPEKPAPGADVVRLDAFRKK
ncbi:MAG: SspB family protein [Amphiplicatus sp.]